MMEDVVAMATGPKGHIVHGVYIEKARRDDVASVSAAAKPAVEAEDDGGELDACSCWCWCWCCSCSCSCSWSENFPRDAL